MGGKWGEGHRVDYWEVPAIGEAIAGRDRIGVGGHVDTRTPGIVRDRQRGESPSGER